MQKEVPGLRHLQNIGKVTEQWLNDADIFTEEDLKQIGPVAAYHRIRLCRHPASLNLLYALQGTLANVSWMQLPMEVKEQLKREL